MNSLAQPAPATSAQPVLENAPSAATPDAGGNDVMPGLPPNHEPTA
ncbi:MAG: hypothetical protein ACREMF_03120 [Gemmatimonadales bacterium]